MYALRIRVEGDLLAELDVRRCLDARDHWGSRMGEVQVDVRSDGFNNLGSSKQRLTWGRGSQEQILRPDANEILFARRSLQSRRLVGRKRYPQALSSQFE